MPITEELRNIKKFESVGFTHEQAEVLTESLEEAVTSGHESLKEFIRNELDNKINKLEIRILESQKDMLLKILGIVTAIVGVAVAIIKLF